MILLYFDMCCLCRQFDDLTVTTVADEQRSIRKIQGFIRQGEPELVWSYVLDDENAQNSDPRKKRAVANWGRYACTCVLKSDEVENIARLIQQTGVKEKDALHVACAISAGCHFFVTTDHRLLKYQDARVKICDPIECLDILCKIV
jgi:predicted nucleic acid-binding protein